MSLDPGQNVAMYAFSWPNPSRLSHDLTAAFETPSNPVSVATPTVLPRTGSKFWNRRRSSVIENSTSPRTTNRSMEALSRPSLERDSLTLAMPGGWRPSSAGRPSSSYIIEKDLPSLPERPLPPIVTTPENEAGPSSRLLRVHSPPRPTTIAIYDASPQASSSVTFALPPPTPSRLGSLDVPSPSLLSKPSVRRTRSFLSPASPSSPASLATPTIPDEFGGRSTGKRRLSIFGSSSVDAKGKGKEKEKEKEKDHETEATADDTDKSLKRKSSFWSRRRSRKDSTPTLPSQHTRQRSQSLANIPVPSLPPMRASSPLFDLEPTTDTPNSGLDSSYFSSPRQSFEVPQTRSSFSFSRKSEDGFGKWGLGGGGTSSGFRSPIPTAPVSPMFTGAEALTEDPSAWTVIREEGGPTQFPPRGSSVGLGLDASGPRRTNSVNRSAPHLPFMGSALSTPVTEDPPYLTPDVTITRSPSTSSAKRLGGRARSNTMNPGSAMAAVANPPLLRRLSQHFFPAAPSVTGSEGSAAGSSVMLALPGVQLPKAALSRRNSSLETTPTQATVPKPRLEEETPERYVERLQEAVAKAEIASVLASSGDAFHTSALREYISKFEFVNDPLDVALRKLLMDLSLPKETQQIDRVMESFAKRYDECNPGLFVNEDNPYVLAFSLMMLHTDAFNKSNKRKMAKADYIKNTRLPGVPPEVLDCFYDNIVFAPFIFIEDPMDVNGQRGLAPEGTPSFSAVAALGGGSGSASATPTGSSMFGTQKIDPYYLITRKLLVSLSEDVERVAPQVNPFSYVGITPGMNERRLQRAFAEAESVDIATPRRRSGSISLLEGEPLPSPRSTTTSVKVTKLGVLRRKEDLAEGGKRASNRKWRSWSVLLAGSQLMFFKDSVLASAPEFAEGGISSRFAAVCPDEVLSLHDAIALYDRTYAKYSNAFRFIMPGGRQYLLLASSDMEMDDWITLINYASAFKTAGIRMRPPSMTPDQARSAGTAAAMSHVNDLRRRRLGSFPGLPPKLVSPLRKAPSTSDLLSSRGTSDLTSSRTGSDQERTLYSSGTLNTSVVSIPSSLLKRRPSTTPVIQFDASPLDTSSDGRLEDTFMEVKEQLAAVTTHTLPLSPLDRRRPLPRVSSIGTISMDNQREEFPSSHSQRAMVIGAKLKDLEARIAAAQSSLDADLRLVRNLSVLQPFQKSTRDRLLIGLPPLAKRIKTMRMASAKLICHRDVLRDDLVAEGREWHATLAVALTAGTTFLRRRQEENGDLVSSPPPVPKMTLSDYSQGKSSPGAVSPLATSEIRPAAPVVHASPQTSVGGSIYSSARASLDHSSDSSPSRPNSTDVPRQNSMDDSLAAKVPPLSSSGLESTIALPSQSQTLDDVKEDAVENTLNSPDSEKDSVARERAEDWNKTRAAKRVSLATMPSDRKLSALTQLNTRHQLRAISGSEASQ